MKLSLNRADLLEALQELIHELRACNVSGEIRIVGGAALSLSYFERDVTQDIDLMNVRGGNNEAVATRRLTQGLGCAGLSMFAFRPR